jgi:protein TonB
MAALLLMPGSRVPAPGEPARMEVIFGANGVMPVPPQPVPPPVPADVAGGPPPPAPATAVPAGADPGLRLDQPDPSLIPARDDPGNRPPAYPPGSWLRHEQGTVLIRLHIAADGTVQRLEKLASSGIPALDDAATAALAHWHFLPARQHGQPVPSYRDQPVRFVIE